MTERLGKEVFAGLKFMRRLVRRLYGQRLAACASLFTQDVDVPCRARRNPIGLNRGAMRASPHAA